MENLTEISRSWLTVDGKVINPNAPTGGGGAGFFRLAVGAAGVDEPFDPELPSPGAPATRYEVLPAVPLQSAKVNSPPATKTGLTAVKSAQDSRNDIDVSVEMLADAVDASLTSAGETVLDDQGLSYAFPNYDTLDGKVTKENSPFTLKGNYTVQTFYRPDAKADDLSLYGRGTTDSDKTLGDVTLGFHESCHRADYLTWLAAKPLPEFKGAVGTTEAQYKKAMNDFKAALKAYHKSALVNSKALTDEVGNPPLSKLKIKP